MEPNVPPAVIPPQQPQQNFVPTPMPQPYAPIPSSNVPPMQAPPPPMGNPTNVQSIVSGPPTQKKNGFGIFVIVAIIILLAVWGFVAYLYFGNKAQEAAPEEVAETLSPALEFHPSEIQVLNGDIARMTSVGESTILVKKEDYTGTGITGFAKVAVSPDNTKLCFESIPPATDPTLYMSNVDGTGIEEIAKNKHTCTWSSDNNFLFYVNDPLGENAINIYAYSLTSKEERNLTESTNTGTEIRQYAITNVSENKINCTYDIVGSNGKKISNANCQIDLVSGEVTELAEAPIETTTP